MGKKRVKLPPLPAVSLLGEQPQNTVGRRHCCRWMKAAVDYRCEQHPNPFDCPDSLIYYEPRFDEYGIIVHDGGDSYTSIDFCPFCGTKLPESKRDLWFDTLEAKGFVDPRTEEVPREFRTDGWFKKKRRRRKRK
jgi:hypothetical protein